MSREERERWDGRYAAGQYVPREQPSGFLLEWLERFEVLGVGPGRALDLACGAGRHALALAEAGWDTTGVDVSSVALERAQAAAIDRGLAVQWIEGDLDEGLPVEGPFGLITVFRYRRPDLWPRLLDALAPDGWLLVEHHVRTTLEVSGPTSPEFRLEPQELLREFASLRVLHYSEVLEHDEETGRLAAVARLAACAGSAGM